MCSEVSVIGAGADDVCERSPVVLSNRRTGVDERLALRERTERVEWHGNAGELAGLQQKVRMGHVVSLRSW